MGQIISNNNHCPHGYSCQHCQVQRENKKNGKSLALNFEKVQDLRYEKMLAVVSYFIEKINKAKQDARKMNDPKYYHQFKRESFGIYIQQLQQCKFPQTNLDEKGICKKVVAGAISSGKSSLLNNLLGLSLEVGVGETTQQFTKVYDQGKVQIYDSPGQNQTYNTSNFETVKNLVNVNQVFILYNDSLKNIEHMVRVILAIKPKNSFFIRTFCDRANQSLNKTLEQEIKTDLQILKSWGIIAERIYKTSSMIENGFDNCQVKQLLKAHPEKNISKWQPCMN